MRNKTINVEDVNLNFKVKRQHWLFWVSLGMWMNWKIFILSVFLIIYFLEL